jgi:4-aminobutyrate aminotransferase-like enzyme/Ser/Thr protein kinase RdoA (MazF antagonist)
MLLESTAALPVTADEAVRLARELYGLRVGAEKLPGEYDDNFHLRAADDGREFVLKIMHPARDRAFVDMQCAALQHLARNAPEIALPRVVPAKNDQLHSEITAVDQTKRVAWLLTFVPGIELVKVRPHSKELLQSVGGMLGQIDAALQTFEHPATQRELKWDLSAPGWIKNHLHEINEPARRALVQKFLALYDSEVTPLIAQLRRSVIYGDANDYNVLVSPPWPLPRQALSVIDFGDMHHGLTVSEVAIACAYAILGEPDVLSVASAVISGFHEKFPLREQEIAALFPLIAMRLAVSVTNSATRQKLKPNDPYVTVSEQPAWQALERLAQIHPRFAHFIFRAACKLTPHPQQSKFESWLQSGSKNAAQLFETDLRTAPTVFFDLGVTSEFLATEPSQVQEINARAQRMLRQANASFGLGAYNEARLLYSSSIFQRNTASPNSAPDAPPRTASPLRERRTIHIGLDLFTAPGTPVYAPFDSTVHAFANNSAPLDYGPIVILKHELPGAETFFTLYGHLSVATLEQLQVGQSIARGKKFATLGTMQENGGWPPHLHFQFILDLLDLDTNFPGVAFASQREVWTSLSPDPNLLVGIPADRFPSPAPTPYETLTTRKNLLGKNLSLSYDKPVKIIRGWMQHLFDDTGRKFLDFYNNVPLVGHNHPHVVAAAQKQLALLNTNTRYLHDTINTYAARLTALLPEPLRVCFFVNSGSEANELAIRLARTHTQREDILVLEHAYHGHTSTLIDISPYKFNGPGGRGQKSWVHVAPLADDYRGKYRRDDPHAGKKYAAELEAILHNAQEDGHPIAAFIAETLPSVGGQIVFPENYLVDVFAKVRAAGAICIADEVQVAFGRLGTHFWGFETQNAPPDIVVLGKPIANGFPLGAVITTPEIAESFANGMEFFSTFGGNPVACAAGLATLEVVENENLQTNVLRVGIHLKKSLQSLQQQFPIIGDVRGSGLFLGLDLVLDRETRAPATAQANYIVNRLREQAILTGTDGPHHNVIKLRPPLIITESDADLFVDTLRSILAEDSAQP